MEASNRKIMFTFTHYLRPWPFGEHRSRVSPTSESSTKAGWLSLKALRKQDGFSWNLYENKMAFVESSTKATLKTLWKPFKKCVNCDNTRFRDKIAYVGGPSFRRRPWPFGERRSRNMCHPAMRSKVDGLAVRNHFLPKNGYFGGHNSGSTDFRGGLDPNYEHS